MVTSVTNYITELKRKTLNLNQQVTTFQLLAGFLTYL
jgi:hypothetical protein